MDWTFWTLIPLLLTALDICIAATATVHVVLNKRDPRAVIAWSGLIWLSPFVGAGLYYCFGVNRIYRKAVALGMRERWVHLEYVPITESCLASVDHFADAYPELVELAYTVRTLTDRTVLPGNRVTPLVNGDQAYPVMLQAIAEATESITLLSYIFDADRAGNEFLASLQAAQRRGVEVRVLVDDVGARYSRPNMISQLCQAGVNATAFLPTRVPRLFQYANLRNHRKILVVDGKTGFTGGTNIREGHWLSLRPEYPVKCLHFQFEGPIVGQIQETFAQDWAFATGESLDGPKWFPELQNVGDCWTRCIPSGPDEDFEKMPLTLLAALFSARESITIMTPYFLPDQPLMEALKLAAMRGVEVRIILPATNNVPVVHWAMLATIPYLIERGCRVLLTPPPFDHTKLFIVDQAWSLVGSTNWDPRSLRLNFEFNIECYSEDLGRQLTEQVNAHLTNVRELQLDDLQSRPLLVRLRDSTARVFSPYL